MDVAALTVAIVSIVLAAGSLGWQVATFLLSGARVKAEPLIGALGNGAAAVGPPSSSMTPQALAAQGFDVPVVAVKVRNLGRMSVNIESVSVRLPVGVEFNKPQAPYNPALPHRLEPQTSETWYFEIADVQATAWAAVESGLASPPITAHGIAALGNGKRVRTTPDWPVITSMED